MFSNRSIWQSRWLTVAIVGSIVCVNVMAIVLADRGAWKPASAITTSSIERPEHAGAGASGLHRQAVVLPARAPSPGMRDVQSAYVDAVPLPTRAPNAIAEIYASRLPLASELSTPLASSDQGTAPTIYPLAAASVPATDGDDAPKAAAPAGLRAGTARAADRDAADRDAADRDAAGRDLASLYAPGVRVAARSRSRPAGEVSSKQDDNLASARILAHRAAARLEEVRLGLAKRRTLSQGRPAAAAAVLPVAVQPPRIVTATGTSRGLERPKLIRKQLVRRPTEKVASARLPAVAIPAPTRSTKPVPKSPKRVAPQVRRQAAVSRAASPADDAGKRRPVVVPPLASGRSLEPATSPERAPASATRRVSPAGRPASVDRCRRRAGSPAGCSCSTTPSQARGDTAPLRGPDDLDRSAASEASAQKYRAPLGVPVGGAPRRGVVPGVFVRRYRLGRRSNRAARRRTYRRSRRIDGFRPSFYRALARNGFFGVPQ